MLKAQSRQLLFDRLLHIHIVFPTHRELVPCLCPCSSATLLADCRLIGSFLFLIKSPCSAKDDGIDIDALAAEIEGAGASKEPKGKKKKKGAKKDDYE